MSFSTTTDKVGPLTLASYSTPLAVTFPFQNKSDLLVLNLGPAATPYATAVTLTLNADYTVDGGGYNDNYDMQTGYATIIRYGPHDVQIGDRMVIVRNAPENQLTSFLTNGLLTVAMIEAALDKGVTLTQAVEREVLHTLRIPYTESNLAEMTKTQRSGSLLAFDTDGNLSFTYGTTYYNGVAANAAAAAASATAAAGSAAAASGSASTAASQAGIATTQANNAASSATSSSNSANSATSSANSATSSANAAASSATGASNSATAAANSASAASTSATNASNSANAANSSAVASQASAVSSNASAVSANNYAVSANSSAVSANNSAVAAAASAVAAAAVIPSQTGNNGKYLKTNGTSASWAAPTTGNSILYGDNAGGFSNVTVGSGLSFTAGTLASTAGGGSVTSVSVTTANGVSGTVANSTTTPAISLTLGDITPSSVTALNNTGGYQIIAGQLTGGDRVGISGQASGTGAALVFFDNAQTTFRPSIFDASQHTFKISGSAISSITSTGIQSAIGATTPAAGTFTDAYATTLSAGFTSVAAAGTVTTLVAASVRDWTVTGSGGQTYQLPDATTLRNGAMFQFNNNQSSGTVVVRNNSATTVATLQSGSYVEIILLSNATATGSWDVHNQAPSNVSWSTNTFDYAGSFTSGTWNGNIVQSNRGGTGNGFTKFSGPTTAEKTFTLPDSNATLLYSGGPLGTPSSATLTSATGLPISTGVSGLGTGIATALAVNVGSAGAPVVNGGALGTPSSGTLTSATGLPLTTGVTGILPAANGGTGVNNGANTITIAGNVTHAGAFTQTFTATANTSLTLPVTGTLATLAGSEALSNKTITASAFNGTVGATTPSSVVATTVTANTSGLHSLGYTSGTGVAGQGLEIYADTNHRAYFTQNSSASNQGAFLSQGARFFKSGGTVTAQKTFSGFNGYGILLDNENSQGFYFYKKDSGSTVDDGAVTLLGSFTPTGLNSTAIGATTPSTGAFTTLSATGIVTAGDYFNATAADNHYRINGTTVIGGSGTALYIKASSSVNTQVPNGSTITTVSSTGLAVTGALTSTGNITNTRTSGTSSVLSLVQSGIIQWDLTNEATSGLLKIGVNGGNNILTLGNSTGLAVTGALSATGSITYGAATDGAFSAIFAGNALNGIQLRDSTDTSGAVFAAFRNGSATTIGSISRVTTTNAVVYNTTSDARLKENLRDFTDSGRLIDSLKPRVFDWKNSDENGKNVIGFIAQEEHAADPIFAHIGAVSVGDEDPETITKQWQRSDSALIPILVAELKALRQRVAALESSK